MEEGQETTGSAPAPAGTDRRQPPPLTCRPLPRRGRRLPYLAPLRSTPPPAASGAPQTLPEAPAFLPPSPPPIGRGPGWVPRVGGRAPPCREGSWSGGGAEGVSRVPCPSLPLACCRVAPWAPGRAEPRRDRVGRGGWVGRVPLRGAGLGAGGWVSPGPACPRRGWVAAGARAPRVEGALVYSRWGSCSPCFWLLRLSGGASEPGKRRCGRAEAEEPPGDVSDSERL